MMLVLCGTKDGREVVNRLLELRECVIASTATKYGGHLIDEHPKLTVISKRMDQNEMIELVKKYNLNAIVDVTHPYAKEVTVNAQNASKCMNIPYFRYERKKTLYDGVTVVNSYDEAVKALDGKSHNILLTIGSNYSHLFIHLRETNNVYLRVLPTVSVIEKCINIGYLPKEIIAIQGPFSKAFNKATYDEYDIDVVVTKDSGSIGGTLDKIQPALEAGIEVILIDREKCTDNRMYDDIDEMINKIEEELL